MENLKKSPMEKEGEIVSDTVTEIAKKTTKRKNSGAKNTTLIKVDNTRPSFKEVTTEYLNVVSKLISETEEDSNKIERLYSQFIVTSEQFISQREMYRKHLCYCTKKVLIHGISYIEHISHQLDSEGAKEIEDSTITFLSKMLNFYHGLVGSEEYLSLIRLIKPETLDKIQNYGNVKPK
jgi:hypothetical protein